MKSINAKYVQLLEMTFEKYKSVEYLNQNSSDEDKPTFINSEIDIFSKTGTLKKKKKTSKSAMQKRTYRPKIVSQKPKSFLEEEDEIIKAAIDKSAGNIEKINIPSLLKLLDRSHASVEQRIKKLLLTGESKHSLKRFSLEEDMVIIDFILDKISKSDKNIENVVKFPSDIIELGPILKRTHQSVFERWKSVLLSTILGYLRKSLNLDIKIMLANYLADNFTSVMKINWTEVSKQPEFSGNTEIGARKVFHRLLYKTSKELDIDKGNITLSQVAEYARNHNLKTRRTEKMRIRQLNIFQYFERKCLEIGLRIKTIT